MVDRTKQIEVTLETVLGSVDLSERIAMRVAASAGFDDEDCHRIGMAVREAVINAYTYGNQRERRKKIIVRLELQPEKLVVHVLDEGKSFELAGIPDPLADENLLRTSGRGIFLIRSFMDELEVHQAPSGGAHLVLTKRFRASRGGDGTAAKKLDKEE